METYVYYVGWDMEKMECKLQVVDIISGFCTVE